MYQVDFRGDRKRFMVEVILSALGSALFALCEWGFLKYLQNSPSTQPAASSWHGDLTIPAWVLVSSHVLLGASLFLFLRGRMILVRSGRAEAMSENLNILRRRSEAPPQAGVIFSSRFTSWPVSEASAPRSSFRGELDEAALNENRTVRRIWNLKDKEDAVRLNDEMTRYAGHANVSIRAYFDLPAFLIPEILVVNDVNASLSFPQVRTLSKIESCLIFKGPLPVQVIREYFEILWNDALPVVESGVLVDSTAARVRNMIP